MDPVGFRIVINKFYDRYQIPLFVVENGLGARNKVENGKILDDYRIDFFKKHLKQLVCSVEEDGVDLMGYTSWSGLDIVSATGAEITKRYGFI
ncbi:family 1 glycosylhydrolase [Paenibacillus albidus]|uniref:family 1 glycosylhydrolase n=1 Tax=Paenibacillus albidus TaxID=2041023 RepID=UPI001BE8C761|nr:family 1 glycosylhydrolase [Paenibacillus albidus]MBT2287603.1 family 1 glycosylhydrolase [Paenibacillus albidus]